MGSVKHRSCQASKNPEGVRRRLLYFFILCGELIRLILPFMYNPIHAIWSDPGRWWGYGTSGIDTSPLALIDPIFFQVWMSLVAKFTLGIPGLTALYAATLSALTPWFWYLFLRELLPAKNRALLGWAILAWLPSWTGIFSYFMSETLLLPLMGISFWLSWRSMRKRTIGAFLLAAVFWTFTSLTRGIAAPIAAAVTLFVWWHQDRKILTLALTTLLLSPLLGSLSYRDYVYTGGISPFGNAALNSLYAHSGKAEVVIKFYSKTRHINFDYGFSSPSIGVLPLEPFSDWQTTRKGALGLRIDLDNQKQSWENEGRLLAANKPKTLILILENITYLFFGPSWPDANMQRIEDALSTWMRFIWLPLFMAALHCLLRDSLKKHCQNSRPLLAALLAWLIFQGFMLLAVGEGRYRKPVEGIIIASLLLCRSRPTTSNNTKGPALKLIH